MKKRRMHNPRVKLHVALVELRKALSKPNHVALAQFMESHGLARDYGKVLLDCDVIKRVRGGTAGPTYYQWVLSGRITVEHLEEIIATYNQKRATQAKQREARIQGREVRLTAREMLAKAGLINKKGYVHCNDEVLVGVMRSFVRQFGINAA